MNEIFYFYPHCYLKCTSSEVLVYDSLKPSYVYIKNNPLSKIDKESFQKGFVKVSERLSGFIDQCFDNGLGYFVEINRVFPYMHNRELDFVTSLHKEREALGYNLQSYTNSLLREVTILLNNSNDAFSDEMCIQMEYPKCGKGMIELDYTFQQLSPFLLLDNIIMSGELDTKHMCFALDYAKERNIHVTHRILYDVDNYAKALELQSRYDNYSVELLVTSSNVEYVRLITTKGICIKAIVKTIDDLKKFECCENIYYLPVMSYDQNNDAILQQMIISKDDVIHSSKSIEECRISDFINPNIFGHLVIDNDGTVYCLAEEIASINDSDLGAIVNKWVGDRNCLWYKTRGRKEACRECALQSLCPPITIYEEMGFYRSPCEM